MTSMIPFDRDKIALKYFWSRSPGQFVNLHTGKVFPSDGRFNGMVREWYETLVENLHLLILNLAASLTNDTKQVECTVSVSPDTLLIFEATVLYNLRSAEDSGTYEGTIDFEEVPACFVRREDDENGHEVQVTCRDKRTQECVFGTVTVLDCTFPF